MDGGKLTVAYCRVSTLEQKRRGYGIEIQIRDVTLFAARSAYDKEAYWAAIRGHPHRRGRWNARLGPADAAHRPPGPTRAATTRAATLGRPLTTVVRSLTVRRERIYPSLADETVATFHLARPDLVGRKGDHHVDGKT